MPSAAGCTASPVPGAWRDRFAGRITRSDCGEVRGDLHPPPDVIAERHHVGARGENSIRELRGQPGAVGRVLAVHDAEIDLRAPPSGREPLLDRAPPRRPEHVGEKEDSQGIDSVAAGYTEIVTPFPASVVKRASACCSSLARSATVPIRDVAAASESPTLSAGSGRSCAIETTVGRVRPAAGCRSGRRPCAR